MRRSGSSDQQLQRTPELHLLPFQVSSTKASISSSLLFTLSYLLQTSSIMPRWPRSLALLLLLLLLLHSAAALYPLPGELPGDNPVPNPGDEPQKPPPQSGPKASDPLGVIAICAKTEVPDACLSAALSADPNVPLDKADAFTVLKLLIKDMITSLSSLANVAKSLMATSKPEDKQKLDSCVGYFDLARSKLQTGSMAKEASGITSSVFASTDNWSACCLNAFDDECPPQLRDAQQVLYDHENAITGISEAFWPSQTTKPDAQYDSYLFLAAHSPAPHLGETWSEPLGVKEICAKSNFPDICQSSASSVATGPLDKADALTVLQLQVKAMIASVIAAREKARSQPGDPKYKVCASQYAPSLNRLQHINGSKTIGGVKGFLDEAVTYWLGCCDSYYNDGKKDCPFSDAEESLIKQNNNTVAILFTFWPEAKRQVASHQAPPVPETLHDPAPPGSGEWLDPYNLADVCSQCQHANICVNSVRVETNDDHLLKVDPPTVIQLLFNKLSMHLTTAKMEAEKLIDHPRTKDPLKSKILPKYVKMYEKATSKIEKGNSTEDIGEAWRYMDEASKAWKACCHEQGGDCPLYDRYENLEFFRSMVDQIIHAFWPQVPLSPDYKAPPSSKGSGGGLKAAAWDHNIKIRRA